MNIELNCYDPEYTDKDLHLDLDSCIKNKCEAIYIPPDNISFLKSIHLEFGANIKIGTTISYPLGFSNTNTKASEFIYACKDGVDCIDFVLSTSKIKSKDFKSLVFELDFIKKLSSENEYDILVRPVIETKFLNKKQITELIKIIEDIGYTSIVNGTGYFREDLIDYIISCAIIKQNSNLDIISTINMDSQKFNELRNLISGIKFKNRHCLEMSSVYIKGCVSTK